MQHAELAQLKAEEQGDRNAHPHRTTTKCDHYRLRWTTFADSDQHALLLTAGRTHTADADTSAPAAASSAPAPPALASALPAAAAGERDEKAPSEAPSDLCVWSSFVDPSEPLIPLQSASNRLLYSFSLGSPVDGFVVDRLGGWIAVFTGTDGNAKTGSMISLWRFSHNRVSVSLSELLWLQQQSRTQDSHTNMKS